MSLLKNPEKKIDFRPFSDQLREGLKEVAQKSMKERNRKVKKTL